MKLYNSLTRQKEDFAPLESKKIRMYVCGITPYDTTHLGHAFTYIFFDALIRYLKHTGNKVTYTQNITDINDRDNDILKRAKEQGIPWPNLANYWTDKFLEDMHTLNWTMPDHFLWASAHIPSMIKIINDLLEQKLAYRINGGVYLDITQKKDFGKLSRYSEEQMLELAEEFDEDITNPDKKNPLDITLWRPTIDSQPAHIPSFSSPYGEGRPGWHLECSSMAICSLGTQIDIHGGGIDLIYPHHDSEIAQSEGATGKTPFSKFWLHTQMVSFEGQKMSKSLGNLVLVSDLLQNYSPNAIRFMLLSNHYRTAWEYHESELIEAEKKVKKIQELIEKGSETDTKLTSNNETMNQFISFLDDDMNTPKALKVVLETIDKVELKQMTEILGFKF